MKNSLLKPIESAARRRKSLDGMWGFRFDPGSVGEAEGWADRLPDSISMPVPASFSDVFTDKDSRDYTGDLWYETDFFVPGEWAGKEILIRFGSVTHRAAVYVNGTWAASHTGGFLPFNAVITDRVRLNAFNHLAVLVNNELSETMIPCGKTAVRPDGRKYVQPYFDFFNYSGIHRPVWLMAVPKGGISDYEAVCSLESDGSALVHVSVETGCEAELEIELIDEDGAAAGRASGREGTITVREPKLWQVRNAYLYTLRIRMIRNGGLNDEYTAKIGIRTFEISDGKFLLNGRPVYLKGFGRHEDSDIRGRGLDLPLIKRDYECMKWIGANCFRASHYPYAEEMYDMADREGFLIVDEVPAVGMFESLMNAVDAASGGGKEKHWFEKAATPELLAHHRDCIREMITRDKNHPSVIAWSLLNEPDTTHASAVPYFESVFALARNSTRSTGRAPMPKSATARPRQAGAGS